MREKSPFARSITLYVLLCVASPALAATLSDSSDGSAAADSRLLRAYGELPLRFESNQGQTDPRVRFLARGPGYNLFLTPNEAVLVLGRPSDGDRGRRNARQDVIRMRLAGARRDPKLVALDPLSGQSNYFVGNDRGKWRTGVPNYARIRYESVYPGIDLVFHGGNQELEYDLVLAPGADPTQICLEFAGARRITLDADGDLVLSTSRGDVKQRRPVLYQEIDGRRAATAGRYALAGKNRVRVEVGAYDRSRPLVIDPVLGYSTYLGGGGADSGYAIALDSSNKVYITGTTQSTNFPVKTGAVQNTFGGKGSFAGDAFVAKFDPVANALVYSSYLGGATDDYSFGIAVDSAGNAYVTGYTDSTNFPIANAFQATFGGGSYDAFLTKLNAAGNALVYSTYLGGNGNDFSRGVAVDAAGSAYLAGYTFSTNFPTVGAFQNTFGGRIFDAFVVKFNASGSALLYSTYLGGNSYDVANGVAVDTSGSIYVTGLTFSQNFPTKNALQSAPGGGTCGSGSGSSPCGDAFVAKFNPAATGASSLIYSTFLGGNDNDAGNAVAVDSFGNVYIAGVTESANFPTVGPFQTARRGATDAFITKLNAAGSAILYSSFLGGSGYDEAYGVAVDAAGNAYVTGITASNDFPTEGAFQAIYRGGTGALISRTIAAPPNGFTFSLRTVLADSFVTKVNNAGSALVYSSYLGGSGDEFGNGIAVDFAGNAYITGSTSSGDFTTANPLQATNAGNGDAFVAKIYGCGDPTTLCLNGNRFRVTTRWTTRDGQTGSGQAVSLTGDTGYFTFFNAANVEMLVKVLNACSFNSSFWTFAGGLTDVNVVLTVTDSQTGAVKTYTNPQGTAFQPIQDTSAFATCASASEEEATAPPDSAAAWLFPPAVSESFDARQAAPCVGDATTLCLNNSRFKVQTQWFTRDGRSGAGQVIPISGDTGAFWFFSSGNVEMVIKTLNGCGVNSRYWTFAGGLTDVNVIMTVTDTQTGVVKTYTNPQGAPFQPIQDTSAFATCP